MSRLPAIDPAKLNADQRKVYDSIASGPRGGVRGPFLALIHVPELTNRIQHLGEYLRYNTSYPPRLSEFAIIVTALMGVIGLTIAVVTDIILKMIGMETHKIEHHE